VKDCPSMIFFGKTRGTALVDKIRALQKHPETNEVFKELYEILTILDGKATGLLTVNAFFITGLAVFLASSDQITKIGLAELSVVVLRLQLISLVVSSFFCLLVVRVTWGFGRSMPQSPTTADDFAYELQRLANVIDDRTQYYRFAWSLALIGFVLTLAWWGWRYALIGVGVVIAWWLGELAARRR